MACDNWQTTAQMFSSLFEKPKMSEKLLSKPPFKYIFDIIQETTKATGFAQGLYEEEENNAQYYDNRDKKLLYLKKMQDLVQLMLKEELPSKPNKVVAGLEPNNTNLFLQAIYRAAVSLENSQPFVKKVLAKLEGGGGGEQEEETQKPSEKKPVEEKKVEEKKKKKPEPEQEQPTKQPEEKPQKKPTKKPKEEEPPQQQPTQQPEQSQQEAPKQKLQRPGTASKRPPKVTSNVKVEDNNRGGKGTQGVIMEGNQDEPEPLDEQPPMQQQNKGQLGDIDTQNRGKFIQDAMQPEEVEEQQNQSNMQDGGDEGPKIKMGRLGGKKKKKTIGGNVESQNQGGTVTTGGSGALSQATDVETLTKLVQNICQNANPLGKSLEFINDDIESMNHELEYWQKQYKASKDKMTNEFKVTEEALQPLHDKLSEIDLQISDQKGKIQNMKAQIIKNQSQIQTLLYSVVTNK